MSFTIHNRTEKFAYINSQYHKVFEKIFANERL